MLQAPCNGNQVFEVAIYNKDVRDLVKENRSHSFYDDQWADVHLHDILAKDETEALAMIENQYPAGEGFVIQSVHLTKI